MKCRFISSLVLASLLFTSYIHYVSATEYPSYIYIAENPEMQSPLSQGTDNYVDYSWFLGNKVKWLSNSQIRSDVMAVIANWQTALPYLQFEEATSIEAYALYFFYVPNPCGEGHENAPGCHRVLDGFTLFDQQRDAAYMKKAFININSLIMPSSGPLLRQVLAHELGHHYGLDERYYLLLGAFYTCNTYERTAMDAIESDENGNPTQACDSIDAPTGLDIQRVDMFWRGGTPSNNAEVEVELRGDLPILADAVGPVATYRWQDMAWAEKHHLILFEYQDPFTLQWIPYNMVVSPYFGGVHLYTESRTMGYIIDISQDPFKEIPNNRTHHACSWAYYAAADAWGNDRCSDGVVLSRPPP